MGHDRIRREPDDLEIDLDDENTLPDEGGGVAEIAPEDDELDDE